MNNTMGTLWWSKLSEAREWPEEMKEATPEQLEGIEIIRDEKGIIVGAVTKTAIIASVSSEPEDAPQAGPLLPPTRQR